MYKKSVKKYVKASKAHKAQTKPVAQQRSAIAPQKSVNSEPGLLVNPVEQRPTMSRQQHAHMYMQP